MFLLLLYIYIKKFIDLVLLVGRWRRTHGTTRSTFRGKEKKFRRKVLINKEKLINNIKKQIKRNKKLINKYFKIKLQLNLLKTK